MKRYRKINHFVPFVLFFSIALLSCSGGGGGGGFFGDNPPPPPLTGSLTGTVSGTTVVAVNQSGVVVGSDDTDGKTPDANGNFPFTLSNIPVGQEVRLFLLTNGGIYPLYFGQPQTNVLILTSEIDVDLGFVTVVDEEFVQANPTSAGQQGKAIPQNDPTDLGDVDSSTENNFIPESLIDPSTSGLSLSELLNRGFEAFEDGALLAANTYFEAAFNLAGSSTSNDADTARIFYAATRIAVPIFDTYSDDNQNDEVDHIGDILDSLGCDRADTARSNIDAISCPDFDVDPLPDDLVTGSEFQQFLSGPVLDQLEGALENIELISPTYTRNLTFETGERVESAEIDLNDVLLFRSAVRGAIAAIMIQSAYNLDADIDAQANDKASTFESFLAGNSGFLTLSGTSPSTLSIAKGELSQAVDDLLAAIDGIQNETDDQLNDLVTLDNAATGDFLSIPHTSSQAEIDRAIKDIEDYKNSLEGPVVIKDNENPVDPNDDFTLDLSRFFAGLNLRDFLPPLAGDQVSGLFPDATFDGVFGSGIDLNEDLIPFKTFLGNISNSGDILILSRGEFISQTGGGIKQGIGLALKKGTGFTNATLNGTYSLRTLDIENFESSTRQAFIRTATITFDGAGAWSGSFEAFDSSGTPDSDLASGTYSVNSDGSFSFIKNNPPPTRTSTGNISSSGEVLIMSGGEIVDSNVTQGIAAAAKIGSGFDNTSLNNNFSLRGFTMRDFEASDFLREAQVITVLPLTFNGSGSSSGTYLEFDSGFGSVSIPATGTYSVSNDGSFTFFSGREYENFSGNISPSGEFFFMTEAEVIGGSDVWQSFAFATKIGGTFSNADLDGLYTFRSLLFDNFELEASTRQAFAIIGTINFDGIGNWSGSFEEFASEGISVNMDVSGTFFVNTDGSFTLKATTVGDGIPDILQ